MVQPRGEEARNPDHPWAEEVYGTFVGNLERRLAAFAKVERDFEEAESDFKAANAAPRNGRGGEGKVHFLCLPPVLGR